MSIKRLRDPNAEGKAARVNPIFTGVVTVPTPRENAPDAQWINSEWLDNAVDAMNLAPTTDPCFTGPVLGPAVDDGNQLGNNVATIEWISSYASSPAGSFNPALPILTGRPVMPVITKKSSAYTESSVATIGYAFLEMCEVGVAKKNGQPLGNVSLDDVFVPLAEDAVVVPKSTALAFVSDPDKFIQKGNQAPQLTGLPSIFHSENPENNELISAQWAFSETRKRASDLLSSYSAYAVSSWKEIMITNLEIAAANINNEELPDDAAIVRISGRIDLELMGDGLVASYVQTGQPIRLENSKNGIFIVMGQIIDVSLDRGENFATTESPTERLVKITALLKLGEGQFLADFFDYVQATRVFTSTGLGRTSKAFSMKSSLGNKLRWGATCPQYIGKVKPRELALTKYEADSILLDRPVLRNYISGFDIVCSGKTGRITVGPGLVVLGGCSSSVYFSQAPFEKLCKNWGPGPYNGCIIHSQAELDKAGKSKDGVQNPAPIRGGWHHVYFVFDLLSGLPDIMAVSAQSVADPTFIVEQCPTDNISKEMVFRYIGTVYVHLDDQEDHAHFARGRMVDGVFTLTPPDGAMVEMLYPGTSVKGIPVRPAEFLPKAAIFPGVERTKKGEFKFKIPSSLADAMEDEAKTWTKKYHGWLDANEKAVGGDPKAAKKQAKIEDWFRQQYDESGYLREVTDLDFISEVCAFQVPAVLPPLPPGTGVVEGTWTFEIPATRTTSLQNRFFAPIVHIMTAGVSSINAGRLSNAAPGLTSGYCHVSKSFVARSSYSFGLNYSQALMVQVSRLPFSSRYDPDEAVKGFFENLLTRTFYSDLNLGANLHIDVRRLIVDRTAFMPAYKLGGHVMIMSAQNTEQFYHSSPPPLSLSP